MEEAIAQAITDFKPLMNWSLETGELKFCMELRTHFEIYSCENCNRLLKTKAAYQVHCAKGTCKPLIRLKRLKRLNRNKHVDDLIHTNIFSKPRRVIEPLAYFKVIPVKTPKPRRESTKLRTILSADLETANLSPHIEVPQTLRRVFICFDCKISLSGRCSIIIHRMHCKEISAVNKNKRLIEHGEKLWKMTKPYVTFTNGYICPICRCTFSICHLLQMHIKYKHFNYVPPIMCKVCPSFRAMFDEDLRVHMETHRKQFTKVERKVDQLFKVTINRCIAKLDNFLVNRYKIVERGEMLQQPMQRKHLRLKVICITCNSKFQSNEELQKHSEIHENVRNTVTKPSTLYGTKFPCTICSKQFTNHCYLKMHIEKVHKKVSTRLQ